MGEMNDQVVAETEFTEFVERTTRRLRQALIARLGPELGADGLSHALSYAWQHWDRMQPMENAIGYLYRVGSTKGRGRPRVARPVFPAPPEHRDPWIEPALPQALAGLSVKQRSAVVLVHCFGWSIREAAELSGTAKSTLQTHLDRGMAKLRAELEVGNVD